MLGQLAKGEDETLLRDLVASAPTWLAEGRATLRVHADTDPDATQAERNAQCEAKLRGVRAGRAKRYVVQVPTAAGPRIVKLAEVTSIGNGLLGLVGRSIARREHAFHTRADVLGLAASRSLGFLEWRVGPWLRRACQVQTLIAADLRPLDQVLAHELATHGDAALESLAEALADMHAKRFFHADLKGFHAFVVPLAPPGDAPLRYRLEWIDLARVGFRLTSRQRVINLYQALRFVVPMRVDAQERFIAHYCRHSGWHRHAPQRALQRVQRLLAHKLRTHPYP